MKDKVEEIVNRYLEGNYLFGNENKKKMIKEILEVFTNQ